MRGSCAGVVVLLAQSAGVITPQQETIQEEPVEPGEPGEPGEPANNYSLTTHYNSLTISDITYWSTLLSQQSHILSFHDFDFCQNSNKDLVCGIETDSVRFLGHFIPTLRYLINRYLPCTLLTKLPISLKVCSCM